MGMEDTKDGAGEILHLGAVMSKGQNHWFIHWTNSCWVTLYV